MIAIIRPEEPIISSWLRSAVCFIIHYLHFLRVKRLMDSNLDVDQMLAILFLYIQ